MDDDKVNDATEKIIGCAFAVGNALGSGFLEKVDENAMLIELRKKGLAAENQKPMTVFYDGIPVGDDIADIVVNSKVVVELKAVRKIDEINQAQLLNYLRACGKRIGSIINFGNPKVEIKRLLNGYD